jgi:hypothetical protein
MRARIQPNHLRIQKNEAETNGSTQKNKPIINNLFFLTKSPLNTLILEKKVFVKKT